MSPDHKQRTVAIIQARMGSSRLPGKVLMKLGSRTLLGYLAARLESASSLDEIVIATTTHFRDDIIVHEAEGLGLNCYRGSEPDVLRRYLDAATVFKADIIARVTADNPFSDPPSIDRVVARIKQGYDYAIEKNLPLGTTGEALSYPALEFLDTAATASRNDAWREHVTLYAKENPHPLRCSFEEAPRDCARPDLSYTVDSFDEYLQMKDLCARVPHPNFPLKELIALADKPAVVNQ
jgi:spore coat polysaccharide biosynthesis protein SpsF